MRVFFPVVQYEFVTCKLRVTDATFDCHHLIAFPMVHSGVTSSKLAGEGKLDIQS